MTSGDIEARILRRLDESGAAPGYYGAAEARAAANEGQRLFVLLTLCLETTATFPLDGGTPFYHMLLTYLDWLVPLRIRVAGGGKLAPCRLADLDALNLNWQSEEEADAPARYACLGFDFLAIAPLPIIPPARSLEITYARSPAVMTGPAATPDIPEEYHPALIDYGIPRLRAKEGGEGFIESLKYFERFLEAADKLAGYVRTRNRAQQYDRGPFELRAADRSKLVAAMKGRATK